MTWEGKFKVTGLVGGQHGGMVQLGTAIVPRKAVYVFEGDKGTPDATLMFEVRDGRPECISVTVEAKRDGRGIRAADLAMISIDTLVTNVFKQLSTLGVHDPEQQRRDRQSIEQVRPTRRGTVTRAELEEVARVYRKNVTSSPTRAVALACGYTDRTAARRVQQARDAGLLPKTTPGKRKA